MHLYTLFVVNICWIIFRAPHTRDALKYCAAMFGIVKPVRVDYTVFWYLDRWTATCLIVALFISLGVCKKVCVQIRNTLHNDLFYQVIKKIVVIGIMYLSLMRIVAGTYNPFIYFQF